MPIYIGVRMKVFSNFPFVLGKNGFPKLFYIHAASIMKYRVEQTGSGRGAENGFLRALGRGARAGIFRRVDYVIRFEQYSVVKPVHIRIGVMMRRKPRYALNILCRSRKPVEKFGYQRGTLLLLKLSERFAVFLACVWASSPSSSPMVLAYDQTLMK